MLALWAVYERRTFRLPPAELLRIALGFTMPLILINHFANTRLAYELFSLPTDYTHVIANLWFADSQGMQLGLLAPGWLHGCLGLHFAFGRTAAVPAIAVWALCRRAALAGILSVRLHHHGPASCPPTQLPQRLRRSFLVRLMLPSALASRIGTTRC